MCWGWIDGIRKGLVLLGSGTLLVLGAGLLRRSRARAIMAAMLLRCLALGVLAACATRGRPAPSNTVEAPRMPVPRTDLSCDGSLAAAGIHGIVTGTSGHPLEGVMIIVRARREDEGTSILTDKRGCYFLGDLPAGTLSIDFVYADVSFGKLTNLALGKIQRLDGQMPVESESNE